MPGWAAFEAQAEEDRRYLRGCKERLSSILAALAESNGQIASLLGTATGRLDRTNALLAANNDPLAEIHRDLRASRNGRPGRNGKWRRA